MSSKQELIQVRLVGETEGKWYCRIEGHQYSSINVFMFADHTTEGKHASGVESRTEYRSLRDPIDHMPVR